MATLRRALELRAGDPSCVFRPSSRGAMLVEFDSHMDREAVVNLSPIRLDDRLITVERHEEPDNRIVIDDRAYMDVAAENFPLEHWTTDHIHRDFHPVGRVYFIDQRCL